MELLSLIPDKLTSLLSFLPGILSLGNLIFGSSLVTAMVIGIFYLVYKDTGKNIKASAFVTAHIVIPWMILGSVLKAIDAILMRPYTHGPVLWFIGLVALFWFVLPHFWLWTKLNDAPRRIKIKASLSFVKSYFRGLVVFPFSVSAWFVVPIVLLFVKKEDNTLPGILEKLYGDINGLHGDNIWWKPDPVTGEGVRFECPLDPNEKQVQKDGSFKSMLECNYWLEGVFQRTYSSRVIWLTRNRSTKLSFALGKAVKNYEEFEHYGSKEPIGSEYGPGWYLIVHDGDVDMMGVMYLGKLFGKYPMCGRVRYGFKLSNLMGPFITVDPKHRYKRAEVINIAISAKGYKGPIN